jgi:hypothetical protein
MEEAGVLLVDCARRGWLGMIPGLDELIAWLDGEDSDQDHKRVASLVRSPHNVFIEVVGGNTIDAKNTGDELVLVSDPKGGLLPAVFPALFPPVRYLRAAVGASGMEAKEFKRLESLARYERDAKTCRILADLLSTPGSTEAPCRQTATTASASARDKVFISYSHKDQKFLDELRTHLKPLVREDRISIWSDQQIEPGAKWFDEIMLALASTKVAVLLVTKDFLASDFIHEHELGPLLKKTQQGGVRILWVLVRGCNYKATPLKDYHALISPDKPLAEMKAERDGAWVKICEAIKAAL